MKRKQKNRISLPLRLGSSVFMGVLVFIAATAIGALIVMKKDVEINKLPFILLIGCGAGSIICSFSAAKKLSFRGIVSGIMSSSILSVILLVLLFAASGFYVSGWYAAILTVDLILGCIAGIIAKNMR